MCQVQVPTNAPFRRNRCKHYFLNYCEVGNVFPAGAHLGETPNPVFQEPPPRGSAAQRRELQPPSRATGTAAARTHRSRPQAACTCHRRPRRHPDNPPRSQAGGGPRLPETCPPRRGPREAPDVPSRRERPLHARVAMTGTSPAVSRTGKPTHSPSLLTQASASPPGSWVRPPPSTRTWPSPGRARPSSPPGSMALAGGPGTHSPDRLRLRSWPRGSAHAQRLRPAGGTHRRTRVARGLRAVPRAGCGVKRAAAVAELFPGATEPVFRASAAAALRPQQPEHLPQLSGVVV